MGKSSGSQDTTQTSEPWSGQQPFLTDVMGQGQNLYQNQQPQYFPDPTYVPFSPQSQMGLDATMQRAQGSPVEQSFQNWVTQSLQQPQVNLGGAAGGADQLLGGIQPGMQALAGQTQQGGLNDFQNFAMQQQGQGGSAFGNAQNFANIGQGYGGQGLESLAQTAQGDFLNGNPFLENQIDMAQRRTLDNLIPQLDAQFGAAGRAGSGLHADVLGERVGQAAGDIETQMRMQAYESERDRQTQAGGQLGQLGLGSGQLGGDLFSRGSQDSLSRLGLGGNLWNEGQGRGLTAGQSLISGGLGGMEGLNDMFGSIAGQQGQAGALAPGAAGLDWQNIDRILGAGSAVEGQAGNVLMDAFNRWNQQQQQPWQSLGQYSDVVQGMPSGYGTQETDVSGGGGSGISGAIGGGMAGYGVGGWPGAIIGGIGGLLG